MIIIDTREQANTHILRYLDKNGIEHCDNVLDFGDYLNTENGVVVERKKNFTELAGNCGKGHARFKRELERMDDAGGKMFVLVEQEGGFDALATWENPRGKVKQRTLKKGGVKPVQPMSGAQIAAICKRWEERHNVEFVFCSKRESPQKLCTLLGVRP